MFFKSMPTIRYNIDNKPKFVTDIFRRIIFTKFQNSKLALQEYYVQEGETPEIVSYNFYGTSYYHWLVLMCNNIVDVQNEWPRPTNSLFEYVESKYGENNASDTHHYILKRDVNGNEVEKEIIVDYDAASLASGDIEEVTNYNYELQQNDDKRQIFLLLPTYVGEAVSTYKRLMSQ